MRRLAPALGWALAALACTADPSTALRGPLPGTGDRPVEVEDGPGGRWVTHAAGRTWVEGTPRRIASVGLSDALLYLGVTPVGEVGSWGNTFLPHLRPHLRDAAYLGGEALPHAVRLEAVYAARPDLIVADVPLADTATALAAIAPTLVLRPTEGSDVIRVRDLGRALGLEDRADAALGWYAHKVETARAVLAEALGDETVGLARVQFRRLKVYGADWFIGTTLYRDLGLRPPTLIGSLVGRRVNAWLPTELLPDLDADHLFLMVAPIRSEAVTLAELTRNPAWRLVPAAQRGRVHAVPIDPWFGTGIMARAMVIDDLLRTFAPERVARGELDAILGALPPAAR